MHFDRGELSEPKVLRWSRSRWAALEARARETEEATRAAAGAIHIELPGRATISVESGADSSLAAVDPREPSPVIKLPVGTKVWIAAGVTDLRRVIRWTECAGAERVARGSRSPDTYLCSADDEATS